MGENPEENNSSGPAPWSPPGLAWREVVGPLILISSYAAFIWAATSGFENIQFRLGGMLAYAFWGGLLSLFFRKIKV